MAALSSSTRAAEPRSARSPSSSRAPFAPVTHSAERPEHGHPLCCRTRRDHAVPHIWIVGEQLVDLRGAPCPNDQQSPRSIGPGAGFDENLLRSGILHEHTVLGFI